MIMISMFLCVFCCSDLGIPYYGTQQIVLGIDTMRCCHIHIYDLDTIGIVSS